MQRHSIITWTYLVLRQLYSLPNITKYTHKNTKALQNNKHKTNHNIKPTKKRNQNNKQNQRKKLHKIFNHDNQHKHNIYDKQNIKNIKKELWRNDRQLSTEERKQLQNRGIYVVEQLVKHKKKMFLK